jgi:hypothetical protein
MVYSYITTNEWKVIRSCLQSPIKKDIKNTINNIIFYNYKNLVVKKAYQFQTLNTVYLYNINNIDIQAYALLGLFDAIKNYNGKLNFNDYCNTYVNKYLFKAIKCLTTYKIIPSNTFDKQQKIIVYNKINFPNFIIKKKNNNIDIEYVHHLVNHLDEKFTKIFYYRFDYKLNKIRTIEEISNMTNLKIEIINKILKYVIIYIIKYY